MKGLRCILLIILQHPNHIIIRKLQNNTEYTLVSQVTHFVKFEKENMLKQFQF